MQSILSIINEMSVSLFEAKVTPGHLDKFNEY